jgi:GNAT superfamily N-acetyltransferase
MKLLARSSFSDPTEFEQRFLALAPLHVDFLRLDLPFEREFWLLEKEGRDIARIGANVSQAHTGVGYIGFFHCAQGNADAGRKILHETMEWLEKRNRRTLYGPVNFSTWHSYRLRVDADPDPSFRWEPTRDPGLKSLLEEAGFTPAQTYCSKGFKGMDGIANVCAPFVQKVLERGFQFREFDLKNHLAREIQAIQRINTQSFNESFLAEPISKLEYERLYAPPLLAQDVRFSHFILDAAGEEVAYFFVFVERGVTIVKTVAVVAKHQKDGLASACLGWSAQRAFEAGYMETVGALLNTQAKSMHLLKRAAQETWTHDYVLFKRE